jgi:hypothetical protein
MPHRNPRPRAAGLARSKRDKRSSMRSRATGAKIRLPTSRWSSNLQFSDSCGTGSRSLARNACIGAALFVLTRTRHKTPERKRRCALSRVHAGASLFHEPVPNAERDGRASNRRRVMSKASARSRSEPLASSTPRASACRTKSSSRSEASASRKVKCLCPKT